MLRRLNFIPPITPQNSAVIKYTQLEKMKQKISNKEDYQKQLKIQQRKMAYQNSMKKIANWPNTIYALKKQKTIDRYQKFKNQEIQRRKIDQEQAIYAQKLKQNIIKQANEKIYANNDRVKTFQLKMLQADVFKQREHQMAIKDTMKEIELIRNNQYDEQMKQKIKKQQEQQLKKIQQHQKKKIEVYKVLDKQHKQMKKNFLKQLQQERMEGQMIRKKAKQQEQEIRIKQFNQKQKAKQLAQQINQFNQLRIQQKERQRLRQKQQEKKINQYMKKKGNFFQTRINQLIAKGKKKINLINKKCQKIKTYLRTNLKIKKSKKLIIIIYKKAN